MSEPCRLRQGEGYEVCDADVSHETYGFVGGCVLTWNEQKIFLSIAAKAAGNTLCIAEDFCGEWRKKMRSFVKKALNCKSKEERNDPMASERGLGKGLGALLGDTSLQTQESGSVYLPISQVEPGLNQPRKQFDQAALDDLSDSIREHGIIQPLTVRRLSSGYYQIIAGERRWRAAKLAGLHEVPAVIIEADDRKVMEIGLIENLQREDLNPMEEADGYLVLKEEFGLTQEEIAKRMGKSRPAIANALRLTGLPVLLREMVVDGDLSAGHARALLSLPRVDLQEKAAQQVISQELTVRQTEALVKKLQEEEKPQKAKPVDEQRIYLDEIEKNLSSRLGRKVSIAAGRKKGKIELEYYDLEDLEALLALLESLKGGSAS